ncbi:unnamed protein product [Ceutorhynchus assimilis]|uniref:Uncharacterized protein n=1 Tax=Ceutorhynchus assimilis TaxID=467358 RepID=A0A9N9N218_9CUCU|nr:unnamed protein product [Ceutorhynchus assimilis]
MKQAIATDLCRVCNLKPETIQHITTACSVIAPKEYLNRHNDVAKIVHSHLCHKSHLIKEIPPYYKYNPSSVIENESTKIYWDTLIVTDKQILHNKPDILYINKTGKYAFVIDFAVPADSNIINAYTAKVTKYQDLLYELKRIYDLKKIEVCHRFSRKTTC